MKNGIFRLIGSLLVIAMLGLILYIAQDTTPEAPGASTPTPSPMTSDEKAMKGLKIE